MRTDKRNFILYAAANFPRSHDIAWDNGAIWIVVGSSNGANEKPEDYRGGLAKYDVTTGRLLETVEFVSGSADPHGLTMHEFALWLRRRYSPRLAEQLEQDHGPSVSD